VTSRVVDVGEFACHPERKPESPPQLTERMRERGVVRVGPDSDAEVHQDGEVRDNTPDRKAWNARRDPGGELEYGGGPGEAREH